MLQKWRKWRIEVYSRMAGKVGATFVQTAFFPGLSPFKAKQPPSHFSPTPDFCKFSFRRLVFPRFLRMAQTEPKTNSPEIQEPSPKIPKLLHQNGDAPSAENPASLLRVKKLSETATLPSRASALAAGYDLSSAKEAGVPARGKALIPTDLSIAIPEGTYARIAPRSGLAWKHSIDVGAGVIDADYRGPVGVILFNHSDTDFEVKVGDRIAQLILEKIITPSVLEVEGLDTTARGDGGFGSTGV